MTFVFGLGGTSNRNGNGKSNGNGNGNGNGKSEIQGSLHCGGKCAAFGRDDVCFWVRLGKTINRNGNGNCNCNCNCNFDGR